MKTLKEELAALLTAHDFKSESDASAFALAYYLKNNDFVNRIFNQEVEFHECLNEERSTFFYIKREKMDDFQRGD